MKRKKDNPCSLKEKMNFLFCRKCSIFSDFPVKDSGIKIVLEKLRCPKCSGKFSIKTRQIKKEFKLMLPKEYEQKLREAEKEILRIKEELEKKKDNGKVDA